MGSNPSYKWDISGISRLNPCIIEVITHLLYTEPSSTVLLSIFCAMAAGLSLVKKVVEQQKGAEFAARMPRSFLEVQLSPVRAWFNTILIYLLKDTKKMWILTASSRNLVLLWCTVSHGFWGGC